jgi:glycosyltransferase involved in cell wall biosynthesis
MSLPERPLRILHLTAGSDAGGLSRYIHDLAVAMIAQGHQVVVAGERGAWHWLFEHAGIPWIDLPLKGSPGALWRSARVLREWMRQHPVDVIHTHYRRPTLVARRLQRSPHPGPPPEYRGREQESSSPCPEDRGRGNESPHPLPEDQRRGQESSRPFPEDQRRGQESSRPFPEDRGPGQKSRKRPPILYSVHLSDLKLSFPWRMFSDFGDQTHVASAEARRWVIEEGRVPPERVTLIPHGVDVSKFPVPDDLLRRNARVSLKLPDDARVAAFVGRLDYPKNVDWLLDVAQALPNLHLLIAGEGPDESSLRAGIERLGIGHRVHLLGHREPLEIYHASDCLLLPSLREGFSLVCAEAMCRGIPVLRTRTAGTSELIIENSTGRSTAIDHDAFVSGAVEFLSLPDAELRRMGAAASAHVRSNFTFDRQLEQTLALYRRIATLSRQ